MKQKQFKMIDLPMVSYKNQGIKGSQVKREVVVSKQTRDVSPLENVFERLGMI